MPTIIKSTTVLESSLKWPSKAPRQKDMYGIGVRDQPGANLRFGAVAWLGVRSADGEPLILATDIAAGSIVSRQVGGATLPAMQVVKHLTINRFDSVAQAGLKSAL
jgi:hypothetical protein